MTRRRTREFRPAAKRACYKNELAEVRRLVLLVARVESDPLMLRRCRAIECLTHHLEILLDRDRPGEAREYLLGLEVAHELAKALTATTH